ncbi:DUF4335 domain-containing protein [Oculatella sp. LEGE 06141]|uniref:DUF4335 domain-containing protein n=1 Tax=Oculatella sp. LEGE 06141 TaxID=1828648 RepID=UPI001881076B|nr:DUF4335 domain-containing protein [Oculatella sp. LEGE 06141]MBE9179237.1 DUF4335 domain-containing protein [Oculatella sp. LEGE 06141]
MSSVLRRYTPPTCTLEIAAKGSPLSRWTDRPVLKQLRFQLSFDDPKLPTEQQVKVRGDRAQLERLCEVVETYIQHTLNQPSHVLMPLRFELPSKPVDQDLSSTEAGIRLKPKGLLSHELWLGGLATEESGSVVHLSALQLFDLANALDEYTAESLAIPSLGRSNWFSRSSGWARIAAIAVLALGASSVLAKFVMDVSSPTAVQTATTTAAQESGRQGLESPVALDDFPDVANLPDATKTAPPSLGNLEPLPPPPVPGSTQPPPPALPSVVVPPNPAVVAPPPSAAQSAPVPAQPSAAPPAAAPPTQAPIALSIPENGAASTTNGGQSPVEGLNDVPPQGADSTARQAPGGGTAFDSIPQIAEVRSYFQDRWQPPDGLAQTLEYRLVLNSDGSLQRITPLGTAAGTYLDRTDMPLLNEPFVSPTDGGQTPQVRLVLRPDGGVQTFADPGS